MIVATAHSLPFRSYKLGPRRHAALAQTFPSDDDILVDSPSPKKAATPQKALSISKNGKRAIDDDATDEDATMAMSDAEIQKRWRDFGGQGEQNNKKKPAAAATHAPAEKKEEKKQKEEAAIAQQQYLTIGTLENFLSGVKIFLLGYDEQDHHFRVSDREFSFQAISMPLRRNS